MRGYVPLLLLLAAIWGASFMFIKVAVDELAPTTTMGSGSPCPAIPLVGLLVARHGLAPASREMRSITEAGDRPRVVNTALPFTLIAWGETKIDSGVAAIANASVPIFVAVLAIQFRASERVHRAAPLRGPARPRSAWPSSPASPEGGWWGVAGTLAVVVASFSYAVGTLYTQGLLDDVRERRARRGLGHVGRDPAPAVGARPGPSRPAELEGRSDRSPRSRCSAPSPASSSTSG